MPVRAFVAQDATADCARAIALIDGFAAERLLVDKGRDTDEILVQAEQQGMEAVIPHEEKSLFVKSSAILHLSHPHLQTLKMRILNAARLPYLQCPAPRPDVPRGQQTEGRPSQQMGALVASEAQRGAQPARGQQGA